MEKHLLLDWKLNQICSACQTECVIDYMDILSICKKPFFKKDDLKYDQYYFNCDICLSDNFIDPELIPNFLKIRLFNNRSYIF